MTEAKNVPLAHALCVYVEPLIVGRRVVVVGDASLGLGARLADLGARIVHVYDPSAERVQWAARSSQLSQPPPPSHRGVVVRDLPVGEFDVRDGAFDVALVPDLGTFPNAAALVARLRRLIGVDGVLVVAARNAAAAGEAPETSARGAPLATTFGAGALDYYELYDLVSMQFEAVRMVGQVPFVGVTLAELGESAEAPQVSVDTQLVAAPSAPSSFIAVGSVARPAAGSAAAGRGGLEPYAIIQLPVDTFASPLTASAASASSATSSARRASADGDSDGQRATHTAALAASLAAANMRLDVLAGELAQARAELAQAPRGAGAGGNAAARVAELEAVLVEAAERARIADARAGDAHVRAERLTHELKRHEEELERQRERNFRLARDVEEEKKRRQKAEVELGMVRKSPELSSARDRVAALEEALRATERANRELLERNAQLSEEAVSGSVSLRDELQREIARMSDTHAHELEALERDLDERGEALRGLESELARAIDSHPREVEQFEAALRERAQTIKALEIEVLRRERIVQELLAAAEDVHADGPSDASSSAWAHEAERARAEADAIRQQLAVRTRELEQAGQALAARTEEGRAFAEALADRTTQLRELAEELARRTAAHDALVAARDAAVAQLADMRARLDGLALETARREAELQTTAWRIAELEQRSAMLEAARDAAREAAELAAASVLATSEVDSAPVPASEEQRAVLDALDAELGATRTKLAAARADVTRRDDELDALRSALAQEHATRARLESGDALARARTEIERQAVLIAQLSQELDTRDRARMVDAIATSAST